MASQMLDRILEAESGNEGKKKQAQDKAAEMIEQARKNADAVLEKGAKDAQTRKKEILDEANAEAEKIILAGKTEAAHDAAEMKKQASEKTDAAAKTVASLLLKIS